MWPSFVAAACFLFGYLAGFADFELVNQTRYLSFGNSEETYSTDIVADTPADTPIEAAVASVVSSTPKKSEHDLCEAKLNALDANFNKRRQARHNNKPKRKNYIGDSREEKVFFDLYEPEAVCFSEERFGTEVRFEAYGDGPKFVCGVDSVAKQKDCLVYSIGSDNDIKFEKAIKTFIGCEIHTFDPTMPGISFKGESYASFHPWGLGTEGEVVPFIRDEIESTFTAMSFDTVLRKLGHENRTIDILKIDCEGCEYTAMPPLLDAIASGKIKVNQILIELHLRTAKLFPFFEALDRAKMRIFHKERNQWGCNGITCVEYAIASEEFLRRANADIICPHEM